MQLSTIAGRTGMFRLLAVAALAATLAAPPSVGPARAAGCSVKGQITPRGGGWTTIKYPAFRDVLADPSKLGTLYPFGGQGGENVNATGVDRWDARVLYVTNGRSLLRSADGGCTWKETFSTGGLTALVDVPPSPDVSSVRTTYDAMTITGIVTPDAKSVHARVHLVIVDGPSGGVVVATSRNGADHWTYSQLDVNAAVPSAGQTPSSAWSATLAVAPRDPNVVYLGVQLRPQGGKLYYRSKDGGAHWSVQSVSDVGDSRHDGQIFLAVNPLNANELWEGDCTESACFDAYGYGDFRHSTDGGATWQRPTNVGNPNASYVAQVLAVALPGANKARVYALYQGNRMYRSDDGGATFPRVPEGDFDEPAMYTSGRAYPNYNRLFPGSNPHDLVAAGPGNKLWILSWTRLRARAKNPWIDVSGRYAVPHGSCCDPKRRWVTAPSISTVTPRRVFFASTPDTFERYEGKA
ncbi:MAG: hypothetical protein QOE45_504 [Frankiaceae bacterium]|jgi:hypothetical protein|nr:hypothetical protein [Frankiaceae bacterium]